LFLRFKLPLLHAIQTFAKEKVGFTNLVQCESVRQQRPKINPRVKYDLHQPSHSLLSARAPRRNYSLTGGECSIGKLMGVHPFPTGNAKGDRRIDIEFSVLDPPAALAAVAVRACH
jgi:hypothetical protein